MANKAKKFTQPRWRRALAGSAVAGLAVAGIMVPGALAQSGPNPSPQPSPPSTLQEGQGNNGSGQQGNGGHSSSANGQIVNPGLSLTSVRIIRQNLNDTNESYVQYEFSRPVISIANPSGFQLLGYAHGTNLPSKDAQLVRNDPSAVLVGYPAGSAVTSYNLAEVPAGVVKDETGRTNMPTSAAIQGSQPVGPAAMPLLQSVSVDNTLNEVTYHFDRNLDTKSPKASSLGFNTSDGNPVMASSIVTSDLNTVTAKFTNQVQDAVRYFANSGAVTDTQGTANPTDALGGSTATPDLSSVSPLIGRTQFDFTFDQPVSGVTAKDFMVYLPNGQSVAGSSAVQPSPNVVRVAFPSIEKYGATVTLASVTPGAVTSNDGSSSPNTTGMATIGQSVGAMAGPVLQSVSVDLSDGQVRYVYDKVVDDNKTYDPSQFSVITEAGNVIPAKGFVDVEGNSVVLNFNAADVRATHAFTTAPGAVNDFQNNPSPLGTVLR